MLDADGIEVPEIAKKLGVGALTVYKWKRRYRDGGLEGLDDHPRPGQPKKLHDDRERALLARTLHALPDDGIAWSIRRLAREEGVTDYQVRATWERARLDGERIHAAIREGIRVSARAPHVLGLVMASPHHVLVLEGGETGDETAALEGLDLFACVRSLVARRFDPASLYAIGDRASFDPGDARRDTFLVDLARIVEGASRGPVILLATESCALRLAEVHTTFPPDIPLDLRAQPTLDAWLAAVESFLPSLERRWNPYARPSVQRLRVAIEEFARAYAKDAVPIPSFVWDGSSRASYVREIVAMPTAGNRFND